MSSRAVPDPYETSHIRTERSSKTPPSQSARTHESTPTLNAAVTSRHDHTTTLATHSSTSGSPHITASPCSTSSGSPNIVHVVIHTTVTISDFNSFYSVPISQFQPSYAALADGSLVSPAFTPNLKVTESWLVIGGAITTFFLMNTLRSIMYCRIVKVKNKSLFYMLSASQAIGLFTCAFFVLADFEESINCTAAGVIKRGGMLLSATLLVPGILGTKAYKCLSNAGFVIVVLVLVHATIIAVTGIVLVEYRGGRRVTGTCKTMFESPLLPVSIALQAMESAFICICFMWAVYRSYQSPADHARLSLTAQDDETSTIDMGEKDDAAPAATERRGWWDYVPDAAGDKGRSWAPPSPALSTPRDFANRFRQWWTGAPVLPSTVFQRKPSTPGELPIPQPPRISSASGANALSLRLSTSRDAGRPSSPPPPSVMERIIRYVPRAEMFRHMLKNELLYTTLLTAVLLVIAVVMWVGITQHLLLGASSWILLDWVVISMCTMHSFGRVARRHEREAWMQDPANWRTIHRAEVEDRTALRPRTSRRAWSPVSASSNWRYRSQQRGESDGPYSFPRYRAPEPADPFSTAGPSRMRSTSLTRSQDGGAVAISRSTSIVSSPMRSMDSVFRSPHPPYAGSPAILPSPEYPSTGASTPQSSDWRVMLSRPSSVAPRSPSSRRSYSASCTSPRSLGAPIWDPENPEPPDLEAKT
ncbi:hypothetical protein C8Q78DRAFT_159237 [Trametes maxima]|nr:hypothetical protein C8Q78DRAFT_159237 [Trametes maxima]